jgi:hypothetical membrane protein
MMIRIAGLCWLLTALYFPVSAVVASAWDMPYSVRDNFISDLGVTACGLYPQRGGVCSPWHAAMNVNLFVIGVLIAAGALLWLRSTNGSLRIPLILLIGAGLASSLVGVFPLDASPAAHNVVAVAFLVLHLLAIIAMAWILRDNALFVGWTAMCALVTITGTIALETSGNFGLGEGIAERIALDTFAIWRSVVGACLLFGLAQLTPARRAASATM